MLDVPFSISGNLSYIPPLLSLCLLQKYYFKTVLLTDNWHIIDFQYCKCIIWQALTYVYTCKSHYHSKMVNISSIHHCPLLIPSSTPPCLSSTNNQASAFCHYRLVCFLKIYWNESCSFSQCNYFEIHVVYINHFLLLSNILRHIKTNSIYPFTSWWTLEGVSIFMSL